MRKIPLIKNASFKTVHKLYSGNFATISEEDISIKERNLCTLAYLKGIILEILFLKCLYNWLGKRKEELARP